MVGLVEKLGNPAEIASATGWAAVSGALGYGFGYLGGFIYAKLADLPAGETAKAYAVAHAALSAINSLVRNLTENTKHAHYINGGVNVLLNSVYIYELRRRGFMGDKLLIICSIGLALSVLSAVSGPDSSKGYV